MIKRYQSHCVMSLRLRKPSMLGNFIHGRDKFNKLVVSLDCSVAVVWAQPEIVSCCFWRAPPRTHSVMPPPPPDHQGWRPVEVDGVEGRCDPGPQLHVHVVSARSGLSCLVLGFLLPPCCVPCTTRDASWRRRPASKTSPLLPASSESEQWRSGRSLSSHHVGGCGSVRPRGAGAGPNPTAPSMKAVNASKLYSRKG